MIAEQWDDTCGGGGEQTVFCNRRATYRKSCSVVVDRTYLQECRYERALLVHFLGDVQAVRRLPISRQCDEGMILFRNLNRTLADTRHHVDLGMA